LYDAGDDVYFVSNINGAPTDRDNDGFLTRMSADGVVDSLMFVAGGRGGVTLHAPKGMVLVGDTIWVADIDVVRGFHRRTGAAVATIQFRPAPVFLNDITVGEDGALYVTDTGIRIVNGEVQHPGPNRIYRVAGRQVSVAAEGTVLDGPNGIVWDGANQRFLIVSFMAGGVLEWRPNEQPRAIASGPGGLDGVVLLNDGRALVSSWADSSLHLLVGDSLQRSITGLPSPAALGIDSRRNRVAVPLFMDDRVEIWQLN
jgi:sugar lactone lactonase YvrE